MDKTAYNECKVELRKIILDRLDCFNDVDDEEVYTVIDQAILEKNKGTYISLKEKRRLRTELFNSLRKLDVLQELVDCSDITEIMDWSIYLLRSKGVSMNGIKILIIMKNYGM